MAGIFIWIIVLLFIVASVKKNPKNTGTGVPNQSNTPYRNPSRPEQSKESSGNQEELKRRLMEKYARYNTQQPAKKVQSREKKEYIPHPKSDILAKASANVAEDFEEKPISSQKLPKADGATEAQMIQKADELAEVDLYRIYEIPQMQQDSELMRMVSDIMAKGVDTELAFSRDFVAEGLDMISNITL